MFIGIGLILLPSVFLGYYGISHLDYQSVSAVPEEDRNITFIGNLSIGNITFFFIDSCRLTKDQLAIFNYTGCGGWAIDNPKTVYIVSNYTESQILDICNHEVYHVYSNATTQEDHIYIEKYHPTFDTCNKLVKMV